MRQEKEKYLLLYLKTGGGHLAPAKSVAAQIKKNNPDVEPLLVDGFEKASILIKAVVEGGYRKSQHIAKWVYEMLYAILKVKIIAKIVAWFISLFIRPYLKEIILKEKPSKIIIFHFFLIDPVYHVLSKGISDIKTYTVVTDPFTAHPLWFLRTNQNFIIFSEELKRHCISKGILPEKLHVFPFILNEQFSGRIGESQMQVLKKDYISDNNKNVLLVLGGGDGIPKGEKILQMLLDNIQDVEIIIVCGKNRHLFQNAADLKVKYNAKHLHIYGYVDFIYELINISDVVITKCGASTSMEILISKKIPIITDYIWEQEKGNKDFIVTNGMGIYIKKLSSLPAAVKLVMTNKNFYRKNIEKADLRNGTVDVAKFISS